MKDIKWSVVVTTAPRELPKLQTTIDCLNKAGWDDPVLIKMWSPSPVLWPMHTHFILQVFQMV